MDVQQILSVAIGTLITVVAAHLAVYWVVKTLYPPPPQVVMVPAPMQAPAPAPVFTPPPVIEQHVELPTYETRSAVAAPTPERKGPPPPIDPREEPPVRGNSGLDSPIT
jgi:hypothetical protein